MYGVRHQADALLYQEVEDKAGVHPSIGLLWALLPHLNNEVVLRPVVHRQFERGLGSAAALDRLRCFLEFDIELMSKTSGTQHLRGDRVTVLGPAGDQS